MQLPKNLFIALNDAVKNDRINFNTSIISIANKIFIEKLVLAKNNNCAMKNTPIIKINVFKKIFAIDLIK